jgi:pimeloyl-ACP methyl ester carboxylesterase
MAWDSQSLDVWTQRYSEGQVIDLDGRPTHYVERGQGPPVILIHGFNLDLNTWITNMDALAAHFTVYALDLWGSGFSSREPMDYGFPLFAEQVRSFMDRLGLERAHLVGHSMGGGTAIFFGVHNRHRVDRLVLVDAVGVPRRIPLRGRLFMLPVIPEILLGLSTDTIRRKNLRDFWIHNGELLTDEYFERVTRYQKIRGRLVETQDSPQELLQHPGAEIRALGELDIPILIVWGPRPVGAAESAHTMHRILRGS